MTDKKLIDDEPTEDKNNPTPRSDPADLTVENDGRDGYGSFAWWQEHEGHIVVHTQPAIAVYINRGGEIAIRQEDLLGEESLITLTPIHEEVFAKAILEAARSLQEPTNLAKIGGRANGKA